MYAYVQNALKYTNILGTCIWEVAEITFRGFIQKMFGETKKRKKKIAISGY